VGLLLPFPSRRPPEIATDAIWIFHELGYGYVGLDPEGFPTAVYPVIGKLPIVGRATGAIRIEYRRGVRIRIRDYDVVRDCCIVTCSDSELERSFGTLVQALARDLAVATDVTSQVFARSFASWERLFLRRRRLSTEEEQGLWGELYFLSNCPSLERAIAVWRGPNAEDYDFLADGIAFEVKASKHRGRHHVSHAQVSQANRPGAVFLISLWVGEDAIDGLTLPQLVATLTERTQDLISFEEKLLSTGYSHADRLLYDRPFASLELPVLYDMINVPRVREMDLGVLSLSYRVQLDRDDEVSEREREAILSRAFEPR
jgi:hypothetical protein